MIQKALHQQLPQAVEQMVMSILDEPRIRRLGASSLPSREVVADCVERMLELMFPGFFGTQGWTEENLPFRIGVMLQELSDRLYEPVRYCLRYRDGDCPNADCEGESTRIVQSFIDHLPRVRELLAEDVQAAFDSDPAATSTDETILCYPGVFAIAVQRLAHQLYAQHVPLLPRIMTEYAHSRTGIDIHPGAELGRSFFIDHGTGVVIGETCVIGDRVKVYQGVTLGALAPAFGQMLRGEKRHPTIEDDVIIYAHATILGGETVVGGGSTIGGNVFITSSVPGKTRVAAEPPVLRYKQRGDKKHRDVAESLDYQI